MRVWILGSILLVSCTGSETQTTGDADAGTVTLRRLNNTELDNTFRDLLGTDPGLTESFPADDLALGFDNIADSLSTSPLHFEMLETAVDQTLSSHVLPSVIEPVRIYVEAESDSGLLTHSVGGVCCGGGAWNLWSNGTIELNVDVEHEGEYNFQVALWGQQAGPENVRVDLGSNGLSLEEFEITSTNESEKEIVEINLNLSPGRHQLYVGFLNDFWDPDRGLDRNVVIDWLEFSGPLGVNFDEEPAGYERVFVCDPSEQGESSCIDEIIAEFGRRAWRRPLTIDEVRRVRDLYTLSRDGGGTFDESVGVAVKAMLLSPHFYFRVEIDPEPDSSAPHALTAWELATRLSYFLWSSMPDEALFEAAADGSLLEDDVIEMHVRRMLEDPKADSIVDNLAGQWLHIRAIDDALPDVWAFENWEEPLRASMKEEMRRMAAKMFLSDRSMIELLTLEETEVDARLANHYGFDFDGSSDWQTVSLEGTERAGWLTTGGLLTLTSYPTRTSPVIRGKWVLSNLLCETPAPPPDNVDAILDEGDAEEGESLADQLARHRADPVCASCHQTMDPIGLGLENFDGIGQWRDVDEVGDPIDASGTLTDGFSFSTPKDLARHIAEDPKFARCVTMQTMTYGLGRGLNVTDWNYLDHIENQFVASDHRFVELAVAIALSDVFRTRRGEEASP